MTSTIRTLTAALMLGATVASASACSAATPATQPVTAHHTLPVPNTPTAPPVTVTTGPSADVPVGGEAAAVFGERQAKAGVQAAYSALETATGVTGLLQPGAHPGRDYESIRTMLTPARWTDLTKAADAGDAHDLASAIVLTVSNEKGTAGTIVVDDGRRITPTAPFLAKAPRLGDYTAVVDRSVPGTTRLVVTIPVTTTYVGTGGTTGTRSRVMTLAMTPAGTGWLVDGWQNQPATGTKG